MLKIYCDENIEIAIVESLKRLNIEASSALEAGNLGLSDEQQLKYASQEDACLFTYDFDFVHISQQWLQEGREHPGIFIIHPLHATIVDCIRKLKEFAEIMDSFNVKKSTNISLTDANSSRSSQPASQFCK
ncbi:MAG TPA: hypothetical protein ENH29_08675 [Bacteroidetes bacterium]|nr:hypothetical protein [Bacteroidota bacterium]